MRNIKLYMSCLLILVSNVVYSQGLDNPLKSKRLFLVNPAAVGGQPGLDIYTYYQTWTSLSQSPEKLFTVVNAAINQQTGVAFGFSNLTEGFLSYTDLKLDFSHKLEFSRSEHLSFGLSTGIVNRSLDLNRVRATNPNDPVLLSGIGKKIYFNAGFGLEYSYKNRFRLGASLPTLYNGQESKLDYSFQVYSLYNLELSDIWKFEPSVFYSYINGGVNKADIFLSLEYNESFWFSLGGSTQKNLYSALGYSYDNLKFEYSYSLHPGDLHTISSSMHVLGFSYLFVVDALKRRWRR